LIAQQVEERNRASLNALTYSKQIPEFASGGIVPGRDRGFDSVSALLRPGEMVLTRAQQGAVMSRGGSDGFRYAGVPGVNQSGRYANGGVAPSSSPADQPINITIEATMVAGTGTQDAFFVRGASTEIGRKVIINQVRATQLRRE